MFVICMGPAGYHIEREQCTAAQCAPLSQAVKRKACRYSGINITIYIARTVSSRVALAVIRELIKLTSLSREAHLNLQHGNEGMSLSPIRCKVRVGKQRTFYWNTLFFFLFVSFHRQLIASDGREVVLNGTESHQCTPWPWRRVE